VAQVRRTILRPVPPLAARGPSPAPPAGGGDARGRGGRAESRDVGAQPLRREADAHPARACRGCAGRELPDARLGAITRFAQPDPRRPAQAPAARGPVAARPSAGCRRDACTLVAEWRRTIRPGEQLGWHNAHPAPTVGAPRPPPSVRRRDRRGRMGMREGVEGARSHSTRRTCPRIYQYTETNDESTTDRSSGVENQSRKA
jgi:hypothetical protein